MLSKINEFKEEIKNQEVFKYYATNYIKSNVNAIICLFEKRSYINDVSFLLTQKGVIASNIQEVHCLIMAIYMNKQMDSVNFQ